MTERIAACDTGGTFTDLVLLDMSSAVPSVSFAKVLSTPPEYGDGIARALNEILGSRDIELLLHSTTVATNAVIDRTGARCALIATEGFRDLLEIRRANRQDLYDILWDPPSPLVPRRHRYGVRERIDYSGNVVTPLDEEHVAAVAECIHRAGVEAIAICFINSFTNPVHELRTKEIVRRLCPECHVFASVELLAEPPEFERTAVTVANAYVTPGLRRYLDGLQEKLAPWGLGQGRVRVMHSAGGTMSTARACDAGVRTLKSGPAAGVMAAAEIAKQVGTPNAVTLDIGGTSADIGLIRNGAPELTRASELEWGLPIPFESIDVISIGAGGGSVAWLDGAGYPKVGPMSAGAVPGPACYGRGGDRPTTTDAHVVLGRIPRHTLGQNSFELDADLAAKAIHDHIAAPIGIPIEEAALGILAITNAEMLRALRLTTIQRGLDPREFPLIVFGGAGPLHAVEIAVELEMPRVVIPPHPGVMNALGLFYLTSLVDMSRVLVCECSDASADIVAKTIGELAAAASAELLMDADAVATVDARVDLRYVGQLHALTLPVETGDALALGTVSAAFHVDHHQRFGHSHPDRPVEISSVRVAARGAGLPAGPLDQSAAWSRTSGEQASQRVLFHGAGWIETPVITRSTLAFDEVITGPALITSLDSTVVLPPRFTAVGDAADSLSVVVSGVRS